MIALYIETKHKNFFLTCVLETNHTNISVLLTCVFAISSDKDKTDYKRTQHNLLQETFHGQLQKAMGTMPRSK